jgi:hypothetical protein
MLVAPKARKTGPPLSPPQVSARFSVPGPSASTISLKGAQNAQTERSSQAAEKTPIATFILTPVVPLFVNP